MEQTPDNKQNKQSNGKLIFLAIASILVFTIQLGNPLAGGHSDEPLYIGIAREMMAKHEWVLPFYHDKLAFYKPPLLYWMMIASFKLFHGSTLFAARFPAALCGILTVIVTQLLANQFFDENKKPLAGWLTLTTIPGIYAFGRAGLMDVPLMLFVTASLYFAVCAIRRHESSSLGFSWLYVGIASLLKGPIGILIPLPAICWLLSTERQWRLVVHWKSILGILGGITILLAWPIAVYLRGEGDTWLHFFVLQENFGKFSRTLDPTTHATPGSVVWIHLLSQFLPWSFLLLGGAVVFFYKKEARDRSTIFLIVWILTVVALFLLPQKKLSHYTLPALPATALLVTSLIPKFSKLPPIRLSFLLTGIVCGLAGLLLLLLSKIAGGLQDGIIIFCSGLCFLLAAYFAFRQNLKAAAISTACFLAFYAAGLPHIMSTLNIRQLAEVTQNEPLASYHLDTNILATALNKEILPAEPPTTGYLIIRKSDQIDFLKKVSPPMMSWNAWKDHIRILDILQAIVSGDQNLIREEIDLVKIR